MQPISHYQTRYLCSAPLLGSARAAMANGRSISFRLSASVATLTPELPIGAAYRCSMESSRHTCEEFVVSP